ncbi:MAG: cytochrome c [Burkholderiales bacterium]
MLNPLRTVLLLLLTLIAPLSLASPGRQDAQAIVEKAVAFAEANGKEKLITEVSKKDGPFHQGELYVFVFDQTGTLLANPAAPDLVGKNDVSKPDADGKLFRKDILDVAKGKGSGWVDYKWKNPDSGKVEPKTSYVKKQGDVIIGAGVYAK